MSDLPTPTKLNLHRQSGILEVSFDDGQEFKLSAEYLRVFSPSAEVRGHGDTEWKLPFDKEAVKIEQIEPVGNYAVILHFDDGHNTGIYAWDTFYELGVNQQAYWDMYLKRLADAGKTRRENA